MDSQHIVTVSHFLGNLNQENYEQLCGDTEGEGDDDIVMTSDDRRDNTDGSNNISSSSEMTCPPTAVGDGDDDEHAADDSNEWEFGIRRAKSAVGKDVEDITLSDIVLDPDGTFTYYWLGVITMSVIYNIIVVILRVAFKEMRDPVIQDSIFNVFDTICDLVYLVDIVILCRVSFYDDGCLVLDPDRIKERYQSSRKFKMDVISIIPYSTIFSLLLGTCGLFYTELLSWFPSDFYIMFVRFPRLLKYPTMAKFFDLTDSRTRNPNLIRAFKLTLNLWVVIHWIGCIYYVLSEYEGLGSNSWVYPSEEEYQYFSRKYIRVTYWSLMTLTTIGERPPPETDLEFVFTGLTFLIGVFVFAAVVGNVGDVISNMNAARTEFQSRMDQLKLYMQHRHVDDNLQNKVKRWADYTWKRSSVDEPSLLQLLPDRLRTEIAINVHLDTLKEVEMFKKCEEGLLRELVLKLRPQTYSPGDYICRIGEIGREMFIVNHGHVEISIPKGPSNTPSVIAKLTRGKYFGEISLLKMDDGQNRRTADVKAVGYAELLRLSRRDLMSALTEYPNAKRILEDIARERVVNTKKEFVNPRRMSTIDETHPDISGRQPAKIAKFIQSKGFQQLLADRTKEQNELFSLIQELKTFDSQNTKSKLESLEEENKSLKTEIAQKDKENASLKEQIKGKRKSRRTSTSHISSKVGYTFCNNTKETCPSSDDASDLTSVDSTRERKLISKDSAYTSSDLSPEFVLGQNSESLTVINDITKDFDGKVGNAAPKITMKSDSESQREENGISLTQSQTSCHNNTSTSETSLTQSARESRSSLTNSKENVSPRLVHTDFLESTSVDSNKNYTYSSHSPSSRTSTVKDAKAGDLPSNSQDISITDSDSCMNNNMPTRQDAEHDLVRELFSKGLDLQQGVHTDNNEHIHTLPNIKCLQQLLSAADDYPTDNSLRSADDSSEDVSDYD